MGKVDLSMKLIVVMVVLASVLGVEPALGQRKEAAWTADEQPIVDQIHGLRSLPDDVRAKTTKNLALQIPQLPASGTKLRLALVLENLATEGDLALAPVQAVA